MLLQVVTRLTESHHSATVAQTFFSAHASRPVNFQKYHQLLLTIRVFSSAMGEAPLLTGEIDHKLLM